MRIPRCPKQFELTNHLGNVLSTVLDRKTPITATGGSGSSTTITHYEGDVVFATDYYPFGSPMSWSTPDSSGGRMNSGVGYRYGFNNQEKEPELGDYYAFEYRIHDARLGRFLSVDPLVKVTMHTYSAFNNNPIRYNDPTGMIAEDPGDIYSSDGNYLKNDGKDDKKVYVVNASKIEIREDGSKKWFVKDQIEVKGLTNEELNLRASLSTLKQTEAGRKNAALDYNAWNNNINFTEDSYVKKPDAYKTHPGTNPDSRSSAAGAYQFLKKYYNESDFSPQSQDKAAVYNMTSKSYAAALSGNMTNFKETTKGRWTSLEHWTVPQLEVVFTSYIAKELSGNSTIATPVGSLLKK